MKDSNNLLRANNRRTIGLWIRGICMGIADVIPGVSGGTVALIMGVYNELVQTIASIDIRFVRAIIQGDLRQAARLSNARFLLPLLLGVFTAIGLFAKLITYLLETYPRPVWGFFMGLILSSALYIARQVKEKIHLNQLLMLLLGIITGYVITILVPVETGTESYKFLLAGMIAICAMILPGISGSFLLVIMGKYQQVFGAVHERQFDVIALFLAGAVIGVLVFSRLLKRLLANYNAMTMYFLVGLMLGSLRKIWPFRRVIEERVMGSKTLVLNDECTWPATMTSEVLITGLLALGGFVLVFMLEYLGQRVARN